MARAIVWETTPGAVDNDPNALHLWDDLTARLSLHTDQVPASYAVNWAPGTIAFLVDIPDENMVFFEQEMHSQPIGSFLVYVPIEDTNSSLEPPVVSDIPSATSSATSDPAGSALPSDMVTPTSDLLLPAPAQPGISWKGGIQVAGAFAAVAGTIVLGLTLAMWLRDRR